MVSLGWPSDLRAFLSKCGTNPNGFTKEAARCVDNKLNELAKLAQTKKLEGENNEATSKTNTYFLILTHLM